LAARRTINMVNPVFPLLLLLPILVAGFPAPQGYSVDKEYPDIEPKYQYQYAVTDDYSKSNFQAEEERDGFSTLGSYRVALPDGRIQIVTYTANESGYVAEVTYEGEAVYPEDFEAGEQVGVGGGLYSGSPSVHSNTVYKANRKKARPAAKSSPKNPFKQTQSSIYKPSPSQYKPAPNRPVKEPSSYSKPPQKGSPFKADRVQPKPVKIAYNQDSPQFNPVPSYRPIPSNPNPYKLYGAQSNPVVPQIAASQPAPAPYDRVRFEEIVKLEPSLPPPAPQPYRPEPRQPPSLTPEYRIQTEGVLLEEAPPPSVAGEKYAEDISKSKSFDKVVKFEEIVKLETTPAPKPYRPEPRQPVSLAPEYKFEKRKEGTTSDDKLEDFDGQVQVVEEEEVKLGDDNLGNAEIVVIDEREEVYKDILEPERSEESIFEEEPSPEVAEQPHKDDADFETEVHFEAPVEAPLEVLFEPADVREVVNAEKETVEESKTETEDTLDISKAVVVKTPRTEVEEEE